jgi:lambda family phage portal protein
MWLDRAIGWLSPRWGLNRLRSRAALQVLSRSYEGGRITRRTSNWTTASTSANAEIAPALATLRNRSRDAVRNNPYARRAINKLVSASVGTGIMARPPDPASKVWKAWCEQADFEGQLDFYGLQTLIARTVFESGECLVRRIREGSSYKGEVPLKLQVLEPDYIDSTRVGPAGNGNYIIAGIEVDPQGRRVAYWLWDKHPGEYVTFPMSLQSRRYDAAEILHIYEKERPGQLRGVPRLAVSLMKLRDLDEYEEAELVRKKIEACFAAFVRTGDGSRTLANSETTTDDAGVTTRTETLSPGMIEYLKPGEEVTFGTPSGGSGYGDYTQTQLHAIAVGAGVTFEQLTGDLSQVNYSSMRGGMLEFRELVELFRWIYFLPMGCRPIFNWFVDAAWTAGKVRTNSYPGVVWTPPKWEWVDPLKDVQGEKLETISGFKTLSAILRERGEDPDEVFAEYAKERAELKKLGLSFDTSAITAKQVDSASTDPAEEPADPNKPAGENKQANAQEREPVNITLQIAEGAVRIDSPVTIADGAIRVEPAQVHHRRGRDPRRLAGDDRRNHRARRATKT